MAIVDRLSEFYKLCKASEACRLIPYLCPAGVWTCGWGSTGPDVIPGKAWTQEYADYRLDHDAIHFALGVLAASPSLATASDSRLSACTDFAYNLGLGAYKGSNFRKAISAANWKEAQWQVMRWVYGGGRVLRGLVRRRTSEAQLLGVE